MKSDSQSEAFRQNGAKDLPVYSVSYQHVLKPGKTIQDYRNWLSLYWYIQKSWGATHVELHENPGGNRFIIRCDYSVKDIRDWTAHAIIARAEKCLQDLEEIVDLKSITIRPMDTHGQNA